jgi:glutathione S-transferase
MGRVVFHIAFASDWDTARQVEEYRVSTRGLSLDEVGFIHASTSREQTLSVASTFYRDVTEPLVLLSVDVDRVGSAVRDEFVGDAPVPFPHVYGPIPVASVSAVAELRRDPDGSFVWPHDLYDATHG